VFRQIRSKLLAAFAVPLAILVAVVAVEASLSLALTNGSKSSHGGVATEAVAFAALGLVGAMIGLVLVIRVSRSVSRSLVDLAQQAEKLATETLPDTVQAILETGGTADDLPEVPEIHVDSVDEVAHVANALETLTTTALELAAGQAALRRNLADAFVNLGRRNQNLVTRQLEYITEIELKEADPASLEELFRLDHLATRMRRNAESLLILAGSGPARQWSASVPLMDVARAASAEVEDYKRLRLHHFDHALVTGAVTTDLVHILAELIENALSFSPPGSAVDVYGRTLEGGYVIVVVDSGIGMSAEDLEIANRRLEGQGSGDEVPGRYLGHFVAGRLGARNGITISLQASHSGGLVARVKVPASVVEDPASDSPVAPEVTSSQVTSSQVTSPQVTSSQVTPSQVTASQVTPSQVTTAQIPSALVPTAQVAAAEVGAAQFPGIAAPALPAAAAVVSTMILSAPLPSKPPVDLTARPVPARADQVVPGGDPPPGSRGEAVGVGADMPGLDGFEPEGPVSEGLGLEVAEGAVAGAIGTPGSADDSPEYGKDAGRAGLFYDWADEQTQVSGDDAVGEPADRAVDEGIPTVTVPEDAVASELDPSLSASGEGWPSGPDVAASPGQVGTSELSGDLPPSVEPADEETDEPGDELADGPVSATLGTSFETGSVPEAEVLGASEVTEHSWDPIVPQKAYSGPQDTVAQETGEVAGAEPERPSWVSWGTSFETDLGSGLEGAAQEPATATAGSSSASSASSAGSAGSASSDPATPDLSVISPLAAPVAGPRGNHLRPEPSLSDVTNPEPGPTSGSSRTEELVAASAVASSSAPASRSWSPGPVRDVVGRSGSTQAAPLVGPAARARSTADALRKLTRRVPGASLPEEDDSLRRPTPTSTTNNPLGLSGALSQYLSATANESRPGKEHIA
jgi:signal transduction histidine kinase